MFLILSGILSILYFYVFLPVFSLSFPSTIIICIFLIGLALTKYDSNRGELMVPQIAIKVNLILIPVIFLVGFFTTSSLIHSRSYRDLIGDIKQVPYHKESLPPIDIKNAPLVSMHMAQQVAQKKLSEIPALGSQVELGIMTKQKIGDHLYWVCFLEHSGFFAWLNTGSTPGYIRVSASDATDVQFVTELEGEKLSLKYLTSAFFGQFSVREIYFSGNKNVGITDVTPEIDDSGRPYLTATLYKPSIGWSGDDVVGVAVLDVQTGKVERYDVANVPAWVDRVYPESFIENQITDWGEYINGWFNPSNQGKLTVSDHVDLVYGQDGQAYFYAGISSVGKDNGVVGFTLTNSRTKSSTLYLLPGASEAVAAGTAVDVMPEKKYHATNPLPFNINGVATYIMTLTDDNGIPRAYGMVSVENYQTLAVSDSLRSTYQAYLNKLASANLATNIDIQKDTLVKLEAIVSRINSETKNNSTNYYLMIEGKKVMFMATSELNEELILTKVGDKVKIGFENETNKLINILEFDNLEIQ